jgi:hypothetical protein
LAVSWILFWDWGLMCSFLGVSILVMCRGWE